MVDQPKCKLLYRSNITLLLCQTSRILLSFGCSVGKLLLKNITGFINKHLESY